MSVSEVLKTVSENLHASANVRNIFGEPIQAGDRTVVPVARISYAFGGGGGSNPEANFGGGGGGKVTAQPVGFLEIGPAGTRFVALADWRRAAFLAAAGFLIGMKVAQFRSRS